MRSVLIVILLFMSPAPESVYAQASLDPQELVRTAERAQMRREGNLLNELISSDANVYEISKDPDRLAGEEIARFPSSMESHAQELGVSLDSIAVGGFVAVESIVLATTTERGSLRRMLSIYRVVDGRIRAVWKLAAEPITEQQSGREVVRRLVSASNSGDVNSFLVLFHHNAKIFKRSEDPRGLAEQIAGRMSNSQGRREAISVAFANGSPAQVIVVGMLDVGDLVISHDRATLPDMRVIHQLKAYRVRNGLITHDWTLAEAASPKGADVNRSAMVTQRLLTFLRTISHFISCSTTISPL